MLPEISVILLTFHSDYNKILNTINSVLCQEKIEYEVIISEDSPDYGYYEKLEKYMEDKKFFKFHFIRNERNEGTVKNFLKALRSAKGKYIKGIGAGDMLYEKGTLHKICQRMEQDQSCMAFGDLKCFTEKQGKRIEIKKNIPEIITPYVKHDKKKILRNIFGFADVIFGAAVVYEKQFLDESLQKIADYVIYAEDLVIDFIILEDRIYSYLSEPVLWYEYGSGISTNGETGNKEKIRKDNEAFCLKLLKEYPAYERLIRRRIRWLRLKRENRYKLIMQECLVVPQYIVYKVVRRILPQRWLKDGRKKE